MPKKVDKIPKISFRYRKSAAEVELELPGFVGMPTPPELDAVLAEYGFMHGCGNEEVAIYIDSLELQGDSFEEDLVQVAYRVPIRLISQIAKGRWSHKVHYEMQIPGAPIKKSDNLYDVFGKAYEAWHKAGRPIGGVPFTTALQGAIDRVNKERSKKALQGAIDQVNKERSKKAGSKKQG